MGQKRIIEDCSGSASPPKKRVTAADTYLNEGKFFLVRPMTGESFCVFDDQERVKPFFHSRDVSVSAFKSLVEAIAFAQSTALQKETESLAGHLYPAENHPTSGTHLSKNTSETLHNDVSYRSDGPDLKYAESINEIDKPQQVVESEVEDQAAQPKSSIAEPEKQIARPQNQVSVSISSARADTLDSLDSVTVYAGSTTSNVRGEPPRMSYGIYFRPDCPYNTSGSVLGPGSPQRAELYAALKAIRVVAYHRLVSSPGRIDLRINLPYVKTSFENWMEKWKKAGWRNANNELLKNSDLWMALDALLVNNSQIRVKMSLSNAGRELGSFFAGRLAEKAIRDSKY